MQMQPGAWRHIVARIETHVAARLGEDLKVTAHRNGNDGRA